MIGSSLRRIAQRAASHARGMHAVVTFDAEQPMSLAQELQARADDRPNQVALWFEGTSTTFAELQQAVLRRASALRKAGIERGHAVALMMDNRPDFWIHVLALSRLGAAPALINTQLVDTGLRHAIMATSPRLAIVGTEHADAVIAALSSESEASNGAPTSPIPTVVWDDEKRGDAPTFPRSTSVAELEASADPAAPPLALTRGSDLAAYIYTSGTTGLPKAGKVLNARAFAAGHGFGRFAMGLHAGDRLYCPLPLFHSNGFLVAASSALVCGCTLALARKFSVRRFWDDIADSHATAFVYIGEVCRYLLNGPPHPRERDHNVRCIVGNGMRPDVWEAFVKRFDPGRVCEFYGATEGNVNMINFLGKVGSVGRMPPLPSLNNALIVKFDHDEQRPLRNEQGRCVACGPDEPGELLGKINPELVTQRFDGYVGEGATQSKILRDVLEPGDAYFRSGDLMRKDKWGWFYFVDRIGDTFRWKGHNVSTNEVADALTKHADVDIANVYGVKVGEMDGRAGMAALVMREGATFDAKAMYKHVAEHLPPYAQPAFLRIVEAATLTATFKLRKVDLLREGYDRDKVKDALFVRDDQAMTYRTLDAEAVRAVEADELRV